MTDPAPGIAAGMSLTAGDRLGPYEIVAPLGAGGMGEVYLARDTRLGREVAIKIISDRIAHDPNSLRRFEKEVKAVASLSHPNILAIHDFGTDRSISFVVMELLRGESLEERLAREHLSWRTALEIAAAVADGVASAHAQGIIHRDLKPANIFLTRDGQVKILDFGLAKRQQLDDSVRSNVETASQPGVVVGTIGYMSPEQVSGTDVDARSDIFALGCILYEMISGERAFAGSSAAETLAAILRDNPRDLSESGKAFPPAIAQIVRRCLQKNPEERFQSARDLAFALKSIVSDPQSARNLSSTESELKALRMPKTSIARPIRVQRSTLAAVVFGLAIVLIAVVLLVWFSDRASRENWVLETAIPEIGRLIDDGEFDKAAALIREARAILPKNSALEKLWVKATAENSFDTIPTGADVSIRSYSDIAWQSHGQTPLKKVRVPKGLHIWRIAKPGFAPTELAWRTSLRGTFPLYSEASVPPGMVPVVNAEFRVLGAKTDLPYPYHAAPEVKMDDYFIDRHEVTNEEYKKFVDAGGYQKRDFWKPPFVKDGRTLRWEEAIALFKDTTGRPGPATWEVGSFPKGKDKHPVAGVSWYEAAAYAEFAGKSLPTAYHWTCASQRYLAQWFIPGSNFRSEGTQPVGAPGTLSGYGTTDMAGNVKEWCLNESAAGKRMILGGGFGEPTYMFVQPDAESPWNRNSNDGFRCVKLLSPPAKEVTGRLQPLVRDFYAEKPVSDAAYKAIKGFYSYDKAELNARIEKTVTTDDWVWQTVSFDAAYGGERVIAHIFLPRNSVPPFQTVVFFPGSGTQDIPKFNLALSGGAEDFLSKSGRAFVFPIYKSTFERRDGWTRELREKKPSLLRDHFIMWSKDFSRTIDYLETRKDIDSTKLAYLGFSWGSGLAPVLVAVDGRVKAAVLVSGGFWFTRTQPEADQLNFVTRVKVPILMLNDRYDDYFPSEASQQPMFRLLGAPNREKRYILYETSHGRVPYREIVRETLNWLDKYLGPVNRRNP